MGHPGGWGRCWWAREGLVCFGLAGWVITKTIEKLLPKTHSLRCSVSPFLKCSVYNDSILIMKSKSKSLAHIALIFCYAFIPGLLIALLSVGLLSITFSILDLREVEYRPLYTVIFLLAFFGWIIRAFHIENKKRKNALIEFDRQVDAARKEWQKKIAEKANEKEKVQLEEDKKEKKRKRTISRKVKKFGFFDTGNWPEEEKLKTLIEIGADRKLFAEKDTSTDILAEKLSSDATEVNLLCSIEKLNDNLMLFPIIHFWLNVDAVQWLKKQAEMGKDFPYEIDIKFIVRASIEDYKATLSAGKELDRLSYREQFDWHEQDFRNLGLLNYNSNLREGEEFRAKHDEFLLYSDNLDNLWFFGEHNIKIMFDTTPAGFRPQASLIFKKIDNSESVELF